MYDAFVIENKSKVIYYQSSGLIVTSEAGSTSGKTAITFSPAKSASNSYKYKTAETVTLPALGEDCSSDYTDWDGSTAISTVTGDEIVIVEVDSSDKAVKANKTIVVAKA